MTKQLPVGAGIVAHVTTYVTPDEHVDDDTGEYGETDDWQVRQEVVDPVSGTSSNLIDCCLDWRKARELAYDLDPDYEIDD